MQVELIVIDPQNDFCVADDGRGNHGTLVVPGANEDMVRTAAMIDRLGRRLDDIHVTLDSHRPIDISHPTWWKRASTGAAPAPFTILGIHTDGKRVVAMTPQADGSMKPTEDEYLTRMPSFMHNQNKAHASFEYLKSLADNGRYPHVIWPEHCLIGSWGASVHPVLHEALCRWERDQFAMVNYVTKGSNPYTEHFSGVKAEVPDPSDPSTQINTDLVKVLQTADIVAITGEALSHCVANTVRDVADCFPDQNSIKKLVLLTDASSNVSGFEFLGSKFVADMTARGMSLSTTVDFLS